MKPHPRPLPLLILALFSLLTGLLPAAEKSFDLDKTKPGELPPGWRVALTGSGPAPRWEILMDDVPPLLPPLTPAAPNVTKKAVLAQLSRDPTDERFPLLIQDDEEYSDFTLKFRFKTVAGNVERMAGVAFRLQDETNYYVLRASSRGNNFRFYKVVNGVRSPPLGPDLPIPSGQWLSLTLECKGNQIRCLLDGREVIPTLTDSTFVQGKFALWTKSDSVSYFTDLQITYTPLEILAKKLLREVYDQFPRLLGLQIYATTPAKTQLHVVAAIDPSQEGTAATDLERNVIATDGVAYGRTRSEILVTLPLHDKNGEAIAALRVTLKPFAGQTEQNAIARATPIAKAIERHIRAGHELTR